MYSCTIKIYIHLVVHHAVHTQSVLWQTKLCICWYLVENNSLGQMSPISGLQSIFRSWIGLLSTLYARQYYLHSLSFDLVMNLFVFTIYYFIYCHQPRNLQQIFLNCTLFNCVTTQNILSRNTLSYDCLDAGREIRDLSSSDFNWFRTLGKYLICLAHST